MLRNHVSACLITQNCLICIYFSGYCELCIYCSGMPKILTRIVATYYTAHKLRLLHYITSPFYCNFPFSSGILEQPFHNGVNPQQNHRSGMSIPFKTGQQTPNPSASACAPCLNSHRILRLHQMRVALL